MEPTDGAPDALEREVQGRCPFAEGVHGKLPGEENEKERGRGPAVLRGGQPRGDHQPCGVRHGAGGACQAHKGRFTVQRREHLLQ